VLWWQKVGFSNGIGHMLQLYLQLVDEMMKLCGLLCQCF